MDKIEYKFDKDNNLYLTLPKLRKNKLKPLNGHSDFLTDPNLSLENHKEMLSINKELSDVSEDIVNLNEGKGKKTKEDSFLLNEIDEKQQKLLFEQLKTKTKLKEPNCDWDMSDDNPKEIMLTKIQQYSPKMKLKQKLLEDLAIYDDLSKIRNKHRILKDIKNKNKKKLHPVDLFCFNRKRWNKQNVNEEKENKDKHANQNSQLIKQKLSKMKTMSYQSEQMSKECDSILNDVILNGMHFDFCSIRKMKKKKPKVSSQNAN